MGVHELGYRTCTGPTMPCVWPLDKQWLILHMNVDMRASATKQSSIGASKVDMRVTKVLLAQGDGHGGLRDRIDERHSSRNSTHALHLQRKTSAHTSLTCIHQQYSLHTTYN